MVTHRILVVSGTRADLGYLRYVIKALEEDVRFEPIIAATGMHLADTAGNTLREFESLGIRVDAEVDMNLKDDSSYGIADSIGIGVRGFSDLLREKKPDCVLVMGDRIEILSAASAALPFLIPVAHISGGDISEGAIDDSIRHAVTKLSHFHFPATEESKARLLQMGEEPWRIRVVGELTLEFLRKEKLLTKKELEEDLGFVVNDQTIMVTFHPETIRLDKIPQHVRALTGALSKINSPMIITGPNMDAGSSMIRESLKSFSKNNTRAFYAESLGQTRYLSLLQYAGAMVGNSSSGLVEAPSFSLPVVNVGSRQDGRIRARNVIDIPCEENAIIEGVQKALSPAFRKTLRDLKNPYGDGKTSEKIVTALSEWLVHREKAVLKKFCSV